MKGLASPPNQLRAIKGQLASKKGRLRAAQFVFGSLLLALRFVHGGCYFARALVGAPHHEKGRSKFYVFAGLDFIKAAMTAAVRVCHVSCRRYHHALHFQRIVFLVLALMVDFVVSLFGLGCIGPYDWLVQSAREEINVVRQEFSIIGIDVCPDELLRAFLSDSWERE